MKGEGFTPSPFFRCASGDIYSRRRVTAQLLGYTLSKFLGIKIVAEARPERRAVAVLGLVALAEAALLAFAVAPPWGRVCLFLNGVPLAIGLEDADAAFAHAHAHPGARVVVIP